MPLSHPWSAGEISSISVAVTREFLSDYFVSFKGIVNYIFRICHTHASVLCWHTRVGDDFLYSKGFIPSCVVIICEILTADGLHSQGWISNFISLTIANCCISEQTWGSRRPCSIDGWNCMHCINKTERTTVTSLSPDWIQQLMTAYYVWEYLELFHSSLFIKQYFLLSKFEKLWHSFVPEPCMEGQIRFLPICKE